MPSVSVVLLGRCRSEEECEWMMQRNVMASIRKSSMCVREGMLVVGNIKSSTYGLLKGTGRMRR